jgi:hypothetical protein
MQELVLKRLRTLALVELISTNFEGERMSQICLWCLLYKKVDYWDLKKIGVELLMLLLKGVRKRSYLCLFSTIFYYTKGWV